MPNMPRVRSGSGSWQTMLRLQYTGVHGMRQEACRGDRNNGNYDVGGQQRTANEGVDSCWHRVRCTSSRLPNMPQPTRATNEDVLLQRSGGEHVVQVPWQVWVSQYLHLSFTN